MNKQSAINLVKSTFENPYNTDRFLNFARNLFHSFEPATFVYRGNYIPDAYKKQIKTLERLGKFEDRDKNKIDILAVCLNQGSTLERARTLQRNFISWYLNGSRGDVTKDAALVAFYVDGSHDWRLSLVKMEYRLGKSDSGRLKTFTELTPAKRFSFLVGENENTHTAQKQLLPTLIKEDAAPTLSDLEKVFSVEVVTKEFFEKYKQLFLDTKEALDKIVKDNLQIQSDFKDKNIDTVDFTKKLLGQIVFLYFLQKKGWFGVARDEDWGTGPKEFLRLLFEKNVIDYDNYFNDILEPLFYEALAIERPDDFYSRFDCKIPFLNGGLFDPLNNYDWVHTDIHLPNHLFSNDNLTKEGDRGTGILDVFDRYNFTVKEDEPLEREVAVDPEMLGKVFENLLEVKDRKSKGTYYTPREIVHYMCQESLANYLVTELEGKASKEDVETLVQIGEAAVEHDTRVTEIGEETETYSYKLPPNIRQNAKLIDDALANIRVCDPAVGSGAFLVGMMTEIIRVRNTISSYFVDGDRSIYEFKHHAIQHSLYGVDIDPGATEIAKLRLWLSLIVDEQDIKKIKPLPNLDYKIMQGNSLLEEFEGIKLFDEELFTKSAFDNTAQVEEIKTKMSELQREFFELYKNNQLQGVRKQQIDAELKKQSDRLKRLTKTPKPQIENGSLFDQVSEAQQKAKELKRLHKEFFNTSHKKEKDQIKKQIESLTWELIEATLREQGKESLMRQVEKYKKANIRPFFLWKLNYSEVFENKGGFDVVIANPPYVKERDNKKVFEEVNKSEFGRLYHQGKMDYWFYFLHKAIDIINTKGIISFITSRYWLNSAGARKLINRIKLELNFLNFVDIGKLKVFDEVAGQHMVAVYSKRKGIDEFVYKLLENDVSSIDNNESDENLKVSVLKNSQIYSEDDQIELENDELDYNNTVPLGSIYDVTQGVVQNPDKVSKKAAETFNLCQGEGVFVLSKNELSLLHLTNDEMSFIKDFYDENDIKKFAGHSPATKFLIYLTRANCFDISTYPNLKSHLEKYKKIMIARRETKNGVNKWFHLHWPREEKYFDRPKIAIPAMFDNPKAEYVDESAYYGLSTNVVIQKNDTYRLKYLVGILNSSLAKHWFYRHGKKRGVGVDIGVNKLRIFPVKIANEKQQIAIIDQVNKILYTIKTNAQSELRNNEIGLNKLIYNLYDLSPEEIAIVEGGSRE